MDYKLYWLALFFQMTWHILPYRKQLLFWQLQYDRWSLVSIDFFVSGCFWHPFIFRLCYRWLKVTRNLLLAWPSSQQLQHFQRGYSSQKPSKCSLSNHFSVLITDPQVMLLQNLTMWLTCIFISESQKRTVYIAQRKL